VHQAYINAAFNQPDSGTMDRSQAILERKQQITVPKQKHAPYCRALPE